MSNPILVINPYMYENFSRRVMRVINEHFGKEVTRKYKSTTLPFDKSEYHYDINNAEYVVIALYENIEYFSKLTSGMANAIHEIINSRKKNVFVITIDSNYDMTIESLDSFNLEKYEIKSGYGSGQLVRKVGTPFVLNATIINKVFGDIMNDIKANVVIPDREEYPIHTSDKSDSSTSQSDDYNTAKLLMAYVLKLL